MSNINATVLEDGSVLLALDGEKVDFAHRSTFVGSAEIDKICIAIGSVAESLAKGLTEVRELTKDVEVEVAFEIASGFNLKIVDLSAKSQIKLKLKL